MSASLPPDHWHWRARARRVIFEADTPAGKTFDLALLVAIMASVLAVCLESVASVRAEWGLWLRVVEWLFTLLFTIEYGLRLITVQRPLRYAVSFFGVVDLLAVLPSYVGLLVPGTHAL
ncbi:MAG TPA: ion transporter, partial [Gammaproteobacteria bacterium]|nr:ion transporter [Gammaproteobacteria bacterium]